MASLCPLFIERGLPGIYDLTDIYPYVVVSPCNKCILMLTGDKTISERSLDTGAFLRSIPMEGREGVSSSFSDDGLSAHHLTQVSYFEHAWTVNVRSTSNGRLVLREHIDGCGVLVAVTPDARFMIMVIVIRHEVMVYETVGEEKRRWTLNEKTLRAVTALAVTPDSLHVVIGQQMGTLRMIEIISGRELWETSRKTIICISGSVIRVTPDGLHVVLFAAPSGSIHIICAGTGTAIAVTPPPIYPLYFSGRSCRCNNKYIAFTSPGSGTTLRLLSIKDGSEVWNYNMGNGDRFLSTVDLSTDGQHLVCMENVDKRHGYRMRIFSTPFYTARAEFDDVNRLLSSIDHQDHEDEDPSLIYMAVSAFLMEGARVVLHQYTE